jgi:hypothetical protein
LLLENLVAVNLPLLLIILRKIQSSRYEYRSIDNSIQPTVQLPNTQFQFKMKMDFTSTIIQNPYFSFIFVSIQHWQMGAQGYLLDRIRGATQKINYGTCKKFLYAIQLLGFAAQFVNKKIIDDFNLSAEIRKKIKKRFFFLKLNFINYKVLQKEIFLMCIGKSTKK